MKYLEIIQKLNKKIVPLSKLTSEVKYEIKIIHNDHDLRQEYGYVEYSVILVMDITKTDLFLKSSWNDFKRLEDYVLENRTYEVLHNYAYWKTDKIAETCIARFDFTFRF